MMRSVSAFCSVTVNASMGTKIGAGTATGVVGGATKVVGCGVWPGAPGAPGVPGAPTWPGFWPTASDTLAPLGGGCMRCVMNQVAPAGRRDQQQDQDREHGTEDAAQAAGAGGKRAARRHGGRF